MTAESRSPPSAPPLWHHPLATGLLLTALALGLRVYTAWDVMGDDPLVLGPDADDWALASMAFLRGRLEELEAHRYPLVPWAAAWMSWSLGMAVPRALLIISIACSCLTPWATLEIGRRFLPFGLAVAAGAWVALAGTEVAFGVYTIAYIPFVLGFLLLAGAIFGAGGRAGPVVAGVGAFLAVASLWQGLLSVLALLPVVLASRRWKSALGCGAGALAGLALVRWLHPGAAGPIGGMLSDMSTNVDINIELQQSFDGTDYWTTLQRWLRNSFGMHWGWMAAVGAVIAQGLLAAASPRLRPTRLLPQPWRVPLPQLGWTWALALAWSLVPLAVLIVNLDSFHHLAHLKPLALVAFLLGVAALLPNPGRWAPLALLAWLVFLPLGFYPPHSHILSGLALQSWHERQFAGKLAAVIDGEGLLLLDENRDLGHCGGAIRSKWAFPLEVELVALANQGLRAPTQLEHAIRTQLPLAVVSQRERRQWLQENYLLEPSGPEVAVGFGPLGTKSMVIPVEAKLARYPD